MAKKTILCLMDYGKECRTGFATVSKNVKRELKKAFGEDLELHILAVNHFGDNYTEEDGTIVLGAKRNDVRSDDFGTTRVQRGQEISVSNGISRFSHERKTLGRARNHKLE